MDGPGFHDEQLFYLPNLSLSSSCIAHFSQDLANWWHAMMPNETRCFFVHLKVPTKKQWWKWRNQTLLALYVWHPPALVEVQFCIDGRRWADFCRYSCPSHPCLPSMVCGSVFHSSSPLPNAPSGHISSIGGTGRHWVGCVVVGFGVGYRGPVLSVSVLCCLGKAQLIMSFIHQAVFFFWGLSPLSGFSLWHLFWSTMPDWETISCFDPPSVHTYLKSSLSFFVLIIFLPPLHFDGIHICFGICPLIWYVELSMHVQSINNSCLFNKSVDWMGNFILNMCFEHPFC